MVSQYPVPGTVRVHSEGVILIADSAGLTATASVTTPLNGNKTELYHLGQRTGTNAAATDPRYYQSTLTRSGGTITATRAVDPNAGSSSHDVRVAYLYKEKY